jgi:hypothetical protein
MSEVTKVFHYISYRWSQHYALCTYSGSIILTDSSYIPTCFGGGSQLHGPNNIAVLSCLSCYSQTYLFSPPLQHRARSCYTSGVSSSVTIYTYCFSGDKSYCSVPFQAPHFKVNIHTFVTQHTKAVIFITYRSMKFLLLVQNCINNYRLMFKILIIYRQTQE